MNEEFGDEDIERLMKYQESFDEMIELDRLSIEEELIKNDEREGYGH